MRRYADRLFTRYGVTQFGLWLGKTLRPPEGYRVAAAFARYLPRINPTLDRAVRSNLRHVVGHHLSGRELDRMVNRLYLGAFCGYYEFFHNLGCGCVDVSDFQPAVRMHPRAAEFVDGAHRTGRGLFIVNCHMSNFDLAGVGLSHYLPGPLQVLSIANPEPGYEVFNQLRSLGRGSITPVTPTSLREAIERLERGGFVMTAVDRPIGQLNEPVTFFGREAVLPTGYIRVPLRTDCLVMTMSSQRIGDDYWIFANEPMEMVRTGSVVRDRAVNLQRVLAQVEGFIRQAPDQWMMFVPVWRDDLARECACRD